LMRELSPSLINDKGQTLQGNRRRHLCHLMAAPRVCWHTAVGCQSTASACSGGLALTC
jgi:hypothetical protein